MNVFELIKEKLEEVRKYECGILNGYCQSTITKAISIVDEVEKEYNNGWIPCSERLPEEKGEYLISTSKGEVTCALYFPNEKIFLDIIEEYFEYSATAWQPLPAPYKEGGTK